jgi:hypothetical protein
MKKIIRLTERDLTRIVKRIIKENDDQENDDQSIIKEKIDSLKKTENKYYNIDNDNVDLVAKKFGKLLAVSKEFFYPGIYNINETDEDNFREIWNNITNDTVENVKIVEFDY